MSELERFEEKQLSSEKIFDGVILHVRKDTVSLPDGNEAFREYIQHVGAVCVVPLTDEGEVVCVKQYRYPIGQVTLEIPAGKLDSKDEDPTDAIIRELREETGAIAKKYTDLGEMIPSPAILGEKIRMYLAEDISFTDRNLDDDEFLEVERIPLNDLYKMVMSGEIKDAKTQIAVLKVWNLINT